MLLNLLKKSTTYKNFTWARAQVCHVHPTPMHSGLSEARKYLDILKNHKPQGEML